MDGWMDRWVTIYFILVGETYSMYCKLIIMSDPSVISVFIKYSYTPMLLKDQFVKFIGV